MVLVSVLGNQAPLRFPQHPQPKATTLFLYLWICLFRTFHINGLTQYVIFCDWILSNNNSVFKVHTSCSMYQSCIPFFAE